MKKCISFKNVSKKYRVYEDRPTTLKEYFTGMKKNKSTLINVLDDVTFNIYKGQIVGIIGDNGQGKSTILKLISRIIAPNSGKIEIKGKVSSLLELGAGFEENFTGRQNIYFNASILGMSKKKINERIEQIIDFSGLREYIDVPVRMYSSGMYMRLAFSVAINVEADVILIDEILAVGDQEFQEKCIDKIMELNKKGKTIVIVSHNMLDIKKVCNRVIWIKDSKIKMDDEPEKVVKEYLRECGIEETKENIKEKKEKKKV